MENDVRQMRAREREAMEGYKKAYQYDYPYEKYDYSMKAAQNMAQQIDQDMLNKILTSTSMQPKGLLKK
jgi:hypothetical protein